MAQRFMSVKNLQKVLDITSVQAAQVRWVVKNVYAVSGKPEELMFNRHLAVGDYVPFCDKFASVQEWVARCHHTPSLVECQMCALNEILGTHGVETIREETGYERRSTKHGWYDRHFWQDTVLLYCNTGETYTPTICYDPREDRFLVCSWGDWYEQNMKETGERQ